MNSNLENQAKIIADILEERHRQDEKWGFRVHHPVVWLPIFLEELGEFSTEILNMEYGSDKELAKERYREELVQATAVLVAMLESHDQT